MKLYFDHILGKQKHHDFLFSLVSATFEPDEWDSAFELGWAPAQKWFDSDFANNNLVWYQSRQSRIHVPTYKPSQKTKNLLKNSNLSYTISSSLDCSLDDIYRVYSEYCQHKHFGDLIDKNKFSNYFSENNYYISFYIDNKLVAITILSLWGSSLFSEAFWWDYKNPELSLGKLSFLLEAELAKSLCIPYLYLGLSYNYDSVYKSRKKGFEFWTGRYWSTDVKLFEYLCSQDDIIETINELHSYQYDYLKLTKV